MWKMWSVLRNYFNCIFSSTAVSGQKRRIEECNESPPKKLRRVDSKTSFKTRSTIDFDTLMESKENCNYDEEDGCCIIGEIRKKNWSSLPGMARKSIHKDHSNPESSYQKGSCSKLDVCSTSESNGNGSQSFDSNVKDVEIVKCMTGSNFKKSASDSKSGPVASRIFKTYRTAGGNSSNSNKSRVTSYKCNMKRRLNFLRESYRLAEKYQYRQLLQSLTNRSSNTILTAAFQKPVCQRFSKNVIPLIDLTKEKSSITIDRSREDVPWTSSSLNKNDENVIDLEGPQSGKSDITRINSLQEYLKTNPATEEDIVQQILSRHSKASNEKKKQVALESAKLEVLSNSNRKAYGDVLEERLRSYLRITSPAVVEVDVEAEEKYELPKLTPEQEAQINKALVPSPASQILAEKFGLQIKRRDMQTLKGLNWLNDEVINFYMNLIMERGKGGKLPKVYAFNTFFYPKLISGGHSSLKRWTKKVDIFSHDMVLVPVHLGMHWCMSLIDFRSREVRYYDSMGSSNNACLQALLTYLEDESLDKKNQPYPTKDWKKKNVEDIPQQMNGSDCGVFSCMFAEHLSRDAPISFSQDNMPYFRRKMVFEILEGKLLT